jgi:hypothetical protein
MTAISRPRETIHVPDDVLHILGNGATCPAFWDVYDAGADMASEA